MKKTKKESFFWTSYSDLMTSLFFVMLVLFVLVIVLLSKKITETEQDKQIAEIEKRKAVAEKQATEKQLAKIREIEESVEKINPEYFEYDAQYKRHTLKNITVSFNRESSNIYDIPQSDLVRLLEVGRSINTFVDEAVKSIPEIKYLLIVEGQSSRDRYIRNHELSYERALALFRYWKSHDIDFDAKHCEVIISGSGQESPFRNLPDNSSNKSNQRFVIHIIPSNGIIEDN
jgi:outer membrane protein OmpA-like peptidoglycan-associated protein